MNRLKTRPLEHTEPSTGRKILILPNGAKPTRVRFQVFEPNGDHIMNAHIFGMSKLPVKWADRSYLTKDEVEQYMRFFSYMCYELNWFESKVFGRAN